jgi:hypothetical protein
MPPTLTSEQVVALAPDQPSVNAARSLAAPKHWVTLGSQGQILWGECKGSAKDPYRAQVDLSGPAYRCSCPSRKFPCKHCLGLLLLATQEGAFEEREPPPWVTEWLASRAKSAERRQERAAAENEPAAATKRAATSAKSAAAREGKVAAGMAELERWLADQLRVGLVALQSRSPGDFDTLAARMIDAQAPGVARLLRIAGGLATSGDGWQERLLAALARLHLLARAYGQLNELSPALQSEVRTLIGFAQSREELLATSGLHDQWVILGRQVEEEDRLRVQRTWLWGVTSARPALVLDFAAPGQSLDRSLIPGSSIEAELVFYPGTVPLRAIVREQHRLLSAVPVLKPLPLAEGHATYGNALAVNPWLERWPLLIGPVRLGQSEQRWVVVDEEDRWLPIHPGFHGAWHYLAMSGGQPFTMFGIWDGTSLTPLALQQENHLFINGR